MVGPGVPQIHDYNPGVTASGLFWTIKVPDRAVAVDSSVSTASYVQQDVTLFDYVNVFTALAGQPAGTAIVSFDTRWKATGKRFRFRDTQKRFSGIFQRAQATLEWKAVGSGFSFQSGPARTSRTTYAAMGREGNGIFFR